MRVAFAVLMTAVAALKISDEREEGNWELASDADEMADLANLDLDDIESCWTDDDGLTVCLSDLNSLDSDLGLAQEEAIEGVLSRGDSEGDGSSGDSSGEGSSAESDLELAQ